MSLAPTIGAPSDNDTDCKPPLRLTAKFNTVIIKINRPQLSPADIQKLEVGMKKVAAGRE